MKKTKFIALALVVAVMLMGAAYAAWTDRLDVNTTINTGELNVRFVGPDHEGGSIYYASPRMDYMDSRGNWNSALDEELLYAEVDHSDKVMTFKFSNMYPGTRGCGLYTIENNGTVPAIINNVTVSSRTLDKGPNDRSEVLPQIRVTHSLLTVVRNGVISTDPDEQLYIVDIPLVELEGVLEGFFNGIRLQPTDKVVLGEIVTTGEVDQVWDTFNFELPFESLNGNAGELETIEIDIGFDFVQHNAYVAPIITE